ncbi:MAG: hypothetical protein DMF92_11630 [Acidobacteria bacterium]|nr:MAG: hypothetical protein DMF92_11630 [Acidobacteriota bacterium]
MKAMVLRAPGELVLDDVARPGLNASHVLVRVTHSGVCGTDLKIYNGAIPVSYPRIMGHEMVGEVVEAGDSHTFRPGERVIVDPELYCGACFHCRIGQTHLCPNGLLVGRDTNGGFAEYVTAPRSHVFRLPDSIDSRTAPLIQVLTTCLHAQRQVNIFPAESVVVFGLGVTGQLHVQLAKARGATVIGITRSAGKRELAEKLGADLTIPGGDGALQQVREATEGRGADLVIETTPPSAWRVRAAGSYSSESSPRKKGPSLFTTSISRSSLSSAPAWRKARTIRAPSPWCNLERSGWSRWSAT